jgi:hypothetical protein
MRNATVRFPLAKKPVISRPLGMQIGVPADEASVQEDR